MRCDFVRVDDGLVRCQQCGHELRTHTAPERVRAWCKVNRQARIPSTEQLFTIPVNYPSLPRPRQGCGKRRTNLSSDRGLIEHIDKLLEVDPETEEVNCLIDQLAKALMCPEWK